MMFMGVVDTLMVGRVSPAALAAVALGNVYFFGPSIFVLGVLMALDPVMAQAVGAGDEPAIRRGLQRGLLLAALLTVPVCLLFLFAGPFMRALGQPAPVVPLVHGYVLRLIPGMLPFFVFGVLRQSLQAMGRMRAIVLSILAANLANVVCNWAFIFGHLGFPAMGVAGSAWSTSINRWLMAALLLGLGGYHLRQYLRSLDPLLFRLAPLGRMARLGAPIGAQMLLEYGAFAAIALLMGRLGTIEVAGHQVALNLASATFMVPLGMGQAVAVLVGHAIGRGDPAAARRAARTALLAGTGFMALTAAAFLLFPAFFARLYTDEGAVVAMAASLIPIAGLFQVFDGLQAVAAGVLRGAGDTRVPMLINVLGFWLLGIPVSVFLGFRLGLGPVGLWWGFVVGLGAVAMLLLLRTRVHLGRALERVWIDRH